MTLFASFSGAKIADTGSGVPVKLRPVERQPILKLSEHLGGRIFLHTARPIVVSPMRIRAPRLGRARRNRRSRVLGRRHREARPNRSTHHRAADVRVELAEQRFDI